MQDTAHAGHGTCRTWPTQNTQDTPSRGKREEGGGGRPHLAHYRQELDGEELDGEELGGDGHEMERHEQHSPEVVVVASAVVVNVALAVVCPSPFLRAQRGLANSTGGQSQPARPKEARAEKANQDQAEPTNEKKRNTSIHGKR